MLENEPYDRRAFEYFIENPVFQKTFSKEALRFMVDTYSTQKLHAMSHFDYFPAEAAQAIKPFLEKLSPAAIEVVARGCSNSEDVVAAAQLFLGLSVKDLLNRPQKTPLPDETLNLIKTNEEVQSAIDNTVVSCVATLVSTFSAKQIYALKKVLDTWSLDQILKEVQHNGDPLMPR